jgi:predicted dehydrogenase
MRRPEEIRAAVVGTGFIGVVHVDALRRLGVEVVGVVGSSPERAREKARTVPLPEPYDSFAAMLADPRVDVVHIASPNYLHAEQAHAALEAGKHVVCEKPLANTADETGELLASARASGLVHATNFNQRFWPQIQEARARVADGAIGQVRLVSGGYLQDWLLHPTDWNWRLDPAQGGALRAVGDIGSHWIDLVSFLTGLPVRAVLADLATFVAVRHQPTGPVETFGRGGPAGESTDRAMESEDAAGVLLRLADGALAVCVLSQVSAGRKNLLNIEVDGSHGALAWVAERNEELWLGHRGKPNELLLRDPSIGSPGAATHTLMPAGHAEGFADTFRELYRAVYADVAAGRPSDEPGYPTFADGHEQAVIGEAVARSARDGRWVEIAHAEHASPSRPPRA